jgi:predicted AlkP superfamily phosphohydrolase/phosphomutase
MILSKKPILLFILLASGLIFFLYLIISKSESSRTFIVGVDGADPVVIRELIAQKKLPHFEYIIQNGSYGIHNVFDTTPDNISSPEIWTSLVTGVRPEHHGITDKNIFYKDTIQDAVFFENTEDRKEPAIWNIFSDYGKKVAVTNWWISYPAEKVNGFIVSNLITEMHWALTQKLYNTPPKAISRIVYPEELLQKLIKFRGSKDYKTLGNSKVMPIARRIFNSFDMNDSFRSKDNEKVEFEEQLDGLPIKTLKFSSIKELVSYAYSFDRDSLMFTKYLLNRHKKLNLVLVYFEGIDIFSHMFWCFRNSKECIGLKKEYIRLFKHYSNMLDNYYMLIDIYLGEILQYLNHNDRLIVCSDHGFQVKDDCIQQLQNGNILTGEHGPEGIFIIYGKNIRKHTVVKHVSLLDVLPTVLYLNRMPLFAKLEGSILFDCIEDSFIKKTKPVFVSGYPTRNKTRSTLRDQQEYPYKEDIKTRLRALGYLN